MHGLFIYIENCPQSIVKWLGFFYSLHGIPLTKRSWENGNCSFDAVDFTVGLDPFGSQVVTVVG